MLFDSVGATEWLREPLDCGNAPAVVGPWFAFNASNIDAPCDTMSLGASTTFNVVAPSPVLPSAALAGLVMKDIGSDVEA